MLTKTLNTLKLIDAKLNCLQYIFIELSIKICVKNLYICIIELVIQTELTYSKLVT